MAEEGDLLLNDRVYDPESMTFRENQEAERILREEILKGDDRDPTMNDRIPAIALVLLRRENPRTTLDAVLDLRPAEVILDAETARKLNRQKKAPPTSATRAKTGDPS